MIKRFFAFCLLVFVGVSAQQDSRAQIFVQSGSNNFMAVGSGLPWNWSIGLDQFYVPTTTTTWFAFEGLESIAGTTTRVPEVATWDAASHTWRGNYLIGTNGLTADDHGQPALIRADSGCEFGAYGSHNSVLQLSSTMIPDDPTSFVNAGPLIGSFATFPYWAWVSPKLYLFYSGQGAGLDVQEALSYYTWTPTACVLGSPTGPVTMFDTAAAAGHGWVIAGNFLVDPNTPTNIYFTWVWAAQSGATNGFANVYLAYLNTLTGEVCSWGGVLCVPLGSQPISLTTMNASFRLVSQTAGQGGIPGLAIIGNVYHVTYHTNQTHNEIHATGPAGAFSGALALATISSNARQDAIRPVALVDNGSGGGMDIYYADGTLGNTASDAGSIIKNTVTAGGSLGSPTTVAAAPGPGNFGYAVTTPIAGGNASAQVAWTEVSSDTIAGTGLQGYIYGTGGFLTRGAFATVFGTATQLDPANTSVDYTLTAGLALTTAVTNGGAISRTLNSYSAGNDYVEIHVSTGTTGTVAIGLVNGAAAITGAAIGQDSFNSAGFYSSGTFKINSANTHTYQSWAAGNTCGIAVNFTAKLFWERCILNGVLTGWNNDVIGNQNPATNTGGASISTLTGGPFYFAIQSVTLNNKVTFNAGQYPFQMTPPAGYGKPQ